MFEDHTFFKGPEGGIYGVSPRVINSGFTPPEGHEPASQEEKDSFLQKVVDNLALPRLESEDELHIFALDLKDKGALSEMIKTVTGVDVDEWKKADIKRIRALKVERDARIEAFRKEEALVEAPVEEVISEKITRHEAALERRQARLQRKQEKEDIVLRQNREIRDFFESLTDDEKFLAESLKQQGLNETQVINVLLARQAKSAGKEV